MTLRDVETIDLPTAAGPMRTQIYRPAETGRFPALVLFSEIFQITGPIRRTAAFLAGHGFVVAVPEVYHEFEPAGSVLAYDQAGADRGNALKIAKPIAQFDDDARACLDFLRHHPAGNGEVGAMGMCLGGHLAFRAAMQAGVRASVCFYATDIHKRSLGLGQCDDSLDRFGDIKGELFMIWGRQDPHVPMEGRVLIYQKLVDAGVRFTWQEYNAAHAFLRDEGHRYDAELAHQTLGQAVAFLRRHLALGR